MEFIDRELELKLLEKEWGNKPSFVVVYGRRRVGKTRLLQEFAKGKDAFFFTFPQAVKEVQIREFLRELSAFLGDETVLEMKPDSWLPVLKYMAKEVDDVLIVLDEFTYAIKSDRTILSHLQQVWDHYLSNKEVMLVLSGSLLGMLWDDVLSYASPLYGRRTRSIHLKPLNYVNSLKFFEDNFYGVEAYMLVGGIPSYLRLASRYSSLEEFVREEFLSDYGFFYDEPYIILGEELRELRVYFSILRAIAEGNRRLEEIANYLGLPARSVYPYIDTLMRLGLVEKETPILGSRRVSLYRIADPVLLTWFTLTYPQLEEISQGTASLANLYKVLSRRFEDLAREFLILKRPIDFERIGRWWFKGEEIDILALDKNVAYLIEVKWSDLRERDAKKVLSSLKEKAKKVKFEGDIRLGLIARSVEKKDELKSEGFLVWDLSDIVASR
ncbi:ATP-binding protein [Pyrococcus kukulkanii]|uniref:ATP-binding protein n=1 Tax=Pyrococcus kukulkanii TaxID=1609559 RepID=UPI003567D045